MKEKEKKGSEQIEKEKKEGKREKSGKKEEKDKIKIGCFALKHT